MSYYSQYYAGIIGSGLLPGNCNANTCSSEMKDVLRGTSITWSFCQSGSDVVGIYCKVCSQNELRDHALTMAIIRIYVCAI